MGTKGLIVRGPNLWEKYPLFDLTTRIVKGLLGSPRFSSDAWATPQWAFPQFKAFARGSTTQQPHPTTTPGCSPRLAPIAPGGVYIVLSLGHIPPVVHRLVGR